MVCVYVGGAFIWYMSLWAHTHTYIWMAMWIHTYRYVDHFSKKHWASLKSICVCVYVCMYMVMCLSKYTGISTFVVVVAHCGNSRLCGAPQLPSLGPRIPNPSPRRHHLYSFNVCSDGHMDGRTFGRSVVQNGRRTQTQPVLFVGSVRFVVFLSFL